MAQAAIEQYRKGHGRPPAVSCSTLAETGGLEDGHSVRHLALSESNPETFSILSEGSNSTNVGALMSQTASEDNIVSGIVGDPLYNLPWDIADFCQSEDYFTKP